MFLSLGKITIKSSLYTCSYVAVAYKAVSLSSHLCHSCHCSGPIWAFYWYCFLPNLLTKLRWKFLYITVILGQLNQFCSVLSLLSSSAVFILENLRTVIGNWQCTVRNRGLFILALHVGNNESRPSCVTLWKPFWWCTVDIMVGLLMVHCGHNGRCADSVLWTLWYVYWWCTVHVGIMVDLLMIHCGHYARCTDGVLRRLW